MQKEDEKLFNDLIKCSCGYENSCQARAFSLNLIDNTNIIINVWKLDGTLIKFNQYAEKVTGFLEEEVIGLGWRTTIVDEEIRSGMDSFLSKMSNGEVLVEHEDRLLCKDGKYINVLWTNYMMYDGKGKIKYNVSIGMDITEIRSIEEIMKKMLYYDQLTGLPNRKLIEDNVNREILIAKEKGSSFALMFMDLDNFKSINDTLGHDIGDKLLKVVAILIKNKINCFSQVARLGGDEFIFLIRDIDYQHEVIKVAKEIKEIFNKPINVDEKELLISTSIGIATYPMDGDSFNELLKNADIAMYYAKEHGKSRYEFFAKIMNDKVAEKSDMEKDLRHAIKYNEFVVYYQPQINLFTGELDGMEALVRWLHPKRGLIPPLKFIPLAEETGLIIEIGNMVLLEACKQNIKWQKAGYKPLRISVNLSVKQFEQEELIEIIDKILKETGMSPAWLDLEITESIVMTNFNFSISMINNLRNMGIHISLDDFGTGYSSLNYLKMFPIDSLKIDKSFLDNLAVDSNEEIIARAIIELAHKMKFDVVAEGVEHSKQLKFLREHSCDKAQGFLFSKPIPKDEFEELLKSNNIFC